jgi:hypothetical protein
MDKKLYKPFKYTGKAKFKYSVYVKGENGKSKKISFGRCITRTVINIVLMDLRELHPPEQRYNSKKFDSKTLYYI